MTLAPSLEVVAPTRNAVGESPLWHADEGAVYWTDIPARAVHRVEVASGAHTRYDVPEMVGCLALADDGGLIAATARGVARLTVDNDVARLERIDDVAYPRDGMRANDGRCDRQGRFWAGTMLMDMAAARDVGRVYRYQRDVNAEVALRLQFDHMIVPNGMAFSPDGKTMYLSDSHPTVQTIWAFDYDTASGTPHNRRVFVDMNPLPGRPDGAAVDADGCYWICGNDAGLVHRFTPEGKLDRSLSVPVKKPAMCAFGGARLDTLYVTSIRPGGDLSDQPLAGGLFALRPGVRGLPEPECVF